MTSGPVVVQVLEGENAVQRNRDIMGATNPANADAGTIRKELAEMYEASTQTRLQQAMQDVWERLLIPLKNMSARLTDKDNGKPTGFQGTLVQNVLDIVDIMRTCNFTNDPAMERVRNELRAALNGVTYDGLKSSAHLRATTKEKIDNIINNIPSLGW